MASRTRRFFQSPLRVMLIAHALAALATGVALITGTLSTRSGTAAAGVLARLGSSVRFAATGAGGMTLLWAMVIPLGVLMVFSLLMGLVYGRWGLPGYLQGRAVFFVPPLAAVYYILGSMILFAVDGRSVAAGWSDTWPMLGSSAGLTLLAIYVSLSTAAVGLGWTVALAVTHHKRRQGKWETIGYVDRTS